MLGVRLVSSLGLFSIVFGVRFRFAHESEAELARILDFYGVAWRYEPDVFPISWNADGEVIESFAPDFYLPEQDMYVELTTMRASTLRCPPLSSTNSMRARVRRVAVASRMSWKSQLMGR